MEEGGSTAPTTGTGTPVIGGKLKLNFSKKDDQFANGGSSAAQSDDDD